MRDAPPRHLAATGAASGAFLVILMSGAARAPAGAQEPPGPSFRDGISLASVGSPTMAPDGRAVAYTVRRADWEANGFDTEIWLWREGEEPFPATRTEKGSSTSPAWSPDGRWLAFLTERGHGRQVYLLPAAGGEAFPATKGDEGVAAFRWSPDGRRIAFRREEAPGDSAKAREERYGRFAVEDAEYRQSHLWVTDLPSPEDTLPAPRRLTGADDPRGYTVADFAWAPDGRRIAFSHRPDPLIASFMRSDLSVVDVETGAVTPLVTLPSSQSSPLWSPDGRWVLFSTGATDTTALFYANSDLARIPADGGEPEVLTSDFDEQPAAVAWLADGVRFTAWQGVRRRLFLLDPETRRISEMEGGPDVFGVDIAPDGRWAAITGSTPTTLSEVYRTRVDRWSPERLTDITAQIAGWDLGTSEVVSWTSEDGARIEGVLRKPPGYDASRRYPLLVTIHGGPTGISRPSPVSGYVYPHLQWLNRGAVVLEPNYRGSAGYGEEFRALNVRNLGVGDAWDVLSGVDHLVEAGIAHPDSLGAMGWSQGGYISAFLTTTSDRFRAISVGAGISDWTTYYVNTDIHPFTRQYLKATPWEDPEIYARTSPITYVKDARTPTLIQHGENDARVPIPNAYLLFQALQDVGVPVQLVVYKGFGHGIDRPKEQLAALWHNWIWFARHLWGEEVALPVEVKQEAEAEITAPEGTP